MRLRCGFCVVRAVLALVFLFTGRAYAAELDLTSVGAEGFINGGLFCQADLETSTGTGVIAPFVRIQANGTEHGYNTDGAHPFDTDRNYCKSLLLSAVPVVNMHGVIYREFFLDINEVNSPNGRYLSLDKLQIYLESTPDISEADGAYPGNFTNLIYDLDADGDNYIKLDTNISSGSGSGDMSALIPNALFGNDETKYVYLYSKFGETYSSDDGFEEWAVGVGGAVIPEPATMLAIAVGGFMILRRKVRQ